MEITPEMLKAVAARYTARQDAEGPQAKPMNVPLSHLASVTEQIKAEIKSMQEKQNQIESSENE